MKKYFIFCLIVGSCCSVQKKESSKQIEENNAAIELNKQATDIIKNSDLPKDEKQKTLAALGTSTGVINESTDTIEQLREDKSQLEFKNSQLSLKGKQQAKTIFWFIIENIVLAAGIIVYILYRIKFAGFSKIQAAIQDLEK